MATNSLLNLPSPFFLGVNYWASHAGTRMWSDWRPEVVERDFRLLADSGVEVLRVFPLWPDFQPIHRLYGSQGMDKGIRFGEQHVPDTEAGHAGMSELMMARFAELAAIAERHNLKLIVGLITGWMSGRLFVPPALEGKPILTDPDAIRWQSRFVTYFIRHTRELDAIIAWDLGNECNVMGEVHSREEAWLWTSSIANAIKSADSSRPLISGMHSLIPSGNWTMQDQGELTDILTTHPYPYWTPYADFDPINTIRPIVHATAESLFYSGIGGKPCFAEEMGTMGPMVCSEEVAAAFARTSMLTQWSHGLPGLLWCANDQTRLEHAPYDWVACESELGLVTEDGRVKPALVEMARIKQQISELPIASLPARIIDAVCIINTEQDHWGTALGSFILAKQAGLEIEYQFEDQPLKDAPLYMLPSLTGVSGIPKRRWEQLLGKIHNGATLYVSMDGSNMLNFTELTGLKVVNRMRRGRPAEVTLHNADEPVNLSIPADFRLELEAVHGEVLATESDGNIVFSKASYGKGTVYFLSLPIELAMAQQQETSYQPEELPYWKIYNALKSSVDSQKVASIQNPNIGITEHPIDPNARITVLINYSPQQQEGTLQLQEGWGIDSVWYGEVQASVSDNEIPVTVKNNEAVFVRLTKRR
ncbi:glycoside hydrolase 5 family protein [Paenibacillus glycanilyticus]|uniref:Beta-mannanase n=1 Tax=Paenibacillus glycanilyticus TaxID=126569 RepID=A0ABQ6GBI9_9BACL|nr:beta-mannanase [Paenibacillus glycanilyticus]GLX66966.1 hypothetical protein MU1_13100 [Paenibacillus glycanilyticus]